MKLSVIITSYNKAPTLERAILSVLKYMPTESDIIIIDDGSTDESWNIIKKYSYTARIFRTDHVGMLETYNFALSLVTGEFFTFCDCDDYWTGNIEKQLNEMVTYNYDFTVTRAITEKNGIQKTIDTNINELREKLTYNNLLIGRVPIYAQTYMIRTSVFNEIIDFKKYLSFYTWDYPIVLEWINHKPIKYLDFYTAVYTITGESITNTGSRKKRFRYILKQYRLKFYFIKKYGCRASTIIIMLYLFSRSMLSIILKRWVRGI